MKISITKKVRLAIPRGTLCLALLLPTFLQISYKLAMRRAGMWKLF